MSVTMGGKSPFYSEVLKVYPGASRRGVAGPDDPNVYFRCVLA